MGGLNSGPGPGITLLLIAIVLVLSHTTSSAPLYEEEEGQESNSQALAESHGCYYNFQHYNEGERILTNEPCLNCTCRNRMLMCYLRVCPFTKGIGQNCTVEKVPGQCCPIITCPEVPVQLLTSTTTEGIKTPDRRHGSNSTAVGHLDSSGCNIDGIFYPNGAQVPASPEKPCELCYCIRNKTACIMQECALHVDGCKPVYEEGQCFPVRYQCDDSPYEESPTTTIRPAPTPGLIITTTSSEPLDCPYNNEIYEDGSRIVTDDPCEHCYCLKGKIACAVQECGAPLEKEGQNCTALPPAPGKCCPDSYQCDITMTSQENQSSEGTTEAGIPSVGDADHSTDGYHPDQGMGTTEEPKHTTDRLHEVTETGTVTKIIPDAKPQELDKGTQYKPVENHLEGLHPMKPSSSSDQDQKITFPSNFKPSVTGRPAESGANKPESDYGTEGQVIHMPHEKQPHPESESHKQGVSTKEPQASGHLHETDLKHPQISSTDSSLPHGQNPFDPTTNDVLVPESSSPSTKDPLLDKLHNIIQDVQSQVSDGKTTEMPEQVDFQTTPQSQTGHFTDKPDILSHLPQFGSQPSSSSSIETGNATSGSSPEDSNDIINKLQGIIHGIYSHVTDSVTSTQTPEGTTLASDVRPSHPVRPDDGSQLLNSLPEKDGSKPIGVQRPADTKNPPEYTAGKPESETESFETENPESDSKYPTKTHSDPNVAERPEETGVTGASGSGTRPQGSIKFPSRPKPDSADEPSNMEGPDATEVPEDSHASESPFITDKPSAAPPGGNSEINETLFDKEKYPGKNKPSGENFDGKHPELSQVTEKPQDQSKEKFPSEKYPEKFDHENYPAENHSQRKPGTTYGTDYPEGLIGKPGDESLSGYYPEKVRPGLYPDEHKPTQQHPEELKPGQNYSDSVKPSGQYSENGKPSGIEQSAFGTEYSESTTDNPDYYTKYTETVHSVGQSTEGYKPGQNFTGQYPEKIKPSSHYHHGGRPTGQYPTGFKPDGQLKEPGQQNTDEKRPAEQHPDKTKPFSTEETPYSIESTKVVSGKPGSSSSEDYPQNFRPKPPGQFPETNKPINHYHEGSRPTENYHSGTEETMSATIYPENATAEDYVKYPEGVRPTGEDSDGTKPIEQQTGYQTGEQPEVLKPSSQSHPHKERPAGQESDKYNLAQFPEGSKPEGQYLEELMPGHHYPHGSKPSALFPEKTKPFGPEETPYGTEYPGVRPTVQYPDRTKPTGQQQEPHKPVQHPYPTKPIGQNLEGYRPSGQPPEKTKPFGTEETPYGTEYPEGTTSRPDDNAEFPESVHSTGQDTDLFKPELNLDVTKYPDALTPTAHHPDGLKPTGQPIEHYKPDNYPEEFKPNQQNLSNVGSTEQYPSEVRPITHFSESFKPTEHYPEYLKPGQKHPEVSKPSEKYPEKAKPSGSEYSPFGTEYPEVKRPEEYKPSQYLEEQKPGEKRPDEAKPSGPYFDKTKPSDTEETHYSTEYQEGDTDRPEDDTNYPEKAKPTGHYSDGSKPTTQYPLKTKPINIPHATEYPESGQGKHPGSEHTTYKTESSESMTEKPDDGITSDHHYYTKVGDGPKGTEKKQTTSKPSDGELPDQKKPTSSIFTEKYPYGDGSEHSTGSDDIHDTKYSGSVSSKPEDGTEYPGSSTRPIEGLLATEYPEPSASTDKPNDLIKDPHGFRPVDDVNLPVSKRPQDPEQQTEGQLYGTEKPEKSGIPDGVTGYPFGLKPGKPDGPEISGKPPGSIPGYGSSTEYFQEIETLKPESEYPEGHKYNITHPDDSELPLKPEGEIFQHLPKPDASEHSLGKPQDGNKYPSGSEEASLVSEDSETSGRPENLETKYPFETTYGTEHPDGVTNAPDAYDFRPTTSSKHPGAIRPHLTGKHPEESKVSGQQENESENHHGTKYPITDRPHRFKPKPGSTDEYLSTEYPETTGEPLGELFGTEHSEGLKPIKGGDFQHPGKVTKRPVAGIKYPEKVSGAEHSIASPEDEETGTEGGFELYPGVSKQPQKPKPDGGVVHTELGIITYRPNEGTDKNLLGKPEGSQKTTSKTTEVVEFTEVSEKEKPGYTQESSTELGYTEEAFITHYPEKHRPPTAEDQLLETGTKADGLTKHTENVKPETGGNETGKPSGHPQETGTYDHPEGFTKTPYHTTKRPVKPTDSTEYAKRPDESKPLFSDETVVTGKPQYFSKYPGETGNESRPGFEEIPFGVNEIPHPSSNYPSGHSRINGTTVTEHQGYPSVSATNRPALESKYPEKPQNATYGTEYDEAGTDRPDESETSTQGFEHTEARPYDSEYPESGVTGQTKYSEGSTSTGPQDSEFENSKGATERPSDHVKHPETLRPTGKPHGSNYLEGVTLSPEDHTERPGELGHFAGVTDRTQDHTKLPEGLRPIGKPHDGSESVYGTKYPEGITDKPEEVHSGRPNSHTNYPEAQEPIEKHQERPYGADTHTEGSKPNDPEYSEEVTDMPEYSTKYPQEFRPTGESGAYLESHQPVGQHSGRPHGTEIYPESSKPQNSELLNGNESSEETTEKPEEGTKHSEKFIPTTEDSKLPETVKPIAQHPGRPHGTYKHPEESKPEVSYVTEHQDEVMSNPEDYTYYPGLGSTERPHGSDEYPEEGKPGSVYSTEYPERVTKYPGVFRPTGETLRPGDRDKYPDIQHPGKPHEEELPHGTEYPEGVTNRPEDYTKYAEGFAPTGFYPGFTGKPDEKSKYPSFRPTEQFFDSKSPPNTQYPELVTGLYPESPQGTNKFTEHPERVSETQEVYTKFPSKPQEGFEPTEHYSGRPHGSDKYPEKGKPALDHGTEFPEGTTDALNNIKLPGGLKPVEDFTKHPEYSEKPHGSEYHDGLTSSPHGHIKHPEGSSPADSTHPMESTELPDAVSGTEYPLEITGKYPGFKPTERYPGAYPEKTEHSETGYEKPFDGTESSLELSEVGTEHTVTDGTQISVKHPGSENEPEGVEYSVTSENPEEQPGNTKYSDESSTKVTDEPNKSKYPGSGKHPQKQKPTGSNDILYNIPHPDNFEKDAETSKTTERIKPSELDEKPYNNNYLESVTSLPEDDTLYTGISKRPTKYPSRPIPESEKPQGSASTHDIKKPNDESLYIGETIRPKPNEPEYGPYGTEYSEALGGLSTEYPYTTEVFSGDSNEPLVPEDSGKPYGTDHSDESLISSSQNPEGTYRPHPQRPKPDDSDSVTTQEPNETENTFMSEKEKQPEYPLDTQKLPQRPKPTGHGPFGINESTTQRPLAFGIYPHRPKPSTGYPDKSDLTEKPSVHLEENKPDDGDAYGSEPPEEEHRPEETSETGIPGRVTGKPLDEFRPTSDHSDSLGVTSSSEKHDEHSSGITADELSTKYPDHIKTPKPGTAYLPLDGQIPNEKIPSSAQLGEDSVPEVSEHSMPTETIFGFTDRTPASSASSSDDYNLHHFESLPNKPLSADLTHEHQTQSYELTTQYPGHQPISQSSLPGAQESEQKPEDGVPGKPIPFIPGEGLHKGQDSTYPSGTEIPSGTGSTHHLSTARPGTEYIGSLHDPTGHKYPDVSVGKPEGLSTPKDNTTKKPIGFEDLKGSTERYPETSTDISHSEALPTGGLTESPVPSDVTAYTPQEVTRPIEDSSPQFQKTTPTENDLINKLHDIISGIQSQVTDGKTTQVPQEGYDSTTVSGFLAESHTDKSSRPAQRPSNGHAPDSSTDDASPFENEIYDQTTTYKEGTEVQTKRPESVYPFEGGSLEHAFGVPSKGPEGITPDELESNLNMQTPNLSKPATPENIYPKTEKPSLIGHPGEELLGKPDQNFSSPEYSSSDEPTTHEPQHSEILKGSPQQSLTLDQELSFVKPHGTTAERDGSTERPHTASDIKGDKKPMEGYQPVTQDTLHTVTPQDPSLIQTSSIPTDKPLHVVYPTYYPEGVVTRKPGAKPEEEADKKVTVTPESIPSSESDSTGAPEDETHTIYDVQTEISSKSSTSAPVVVVQEVHTEVHSERATTKSGTEVYIQQTTESKPESFSGKPEVTAEESTEKSQSPGKTPQVVFGRPAITQPTGDELQPESQTLKPHGGHSEVEKSPHLSTDPLNPESTTKPGFVTVTPVGFGPFTKESEHIMHLYSPKDKHPGSTSSSQYILPSSTTEKEQTVGFTESQPAFATDSGVTPKPDISGTRFPSRKTTQKPTDGVPPSVEGTTIIPTQGIGEEYLTSHFFVTKQPSFGISTEGLPTEVTGHTAGDYTTKSPEGASYVPYKVINGTKVYYPEKETSQEPNSSQPSPFDGYDHIPFKVVNGTKFFYPNRVVTPQPAFTTTTGAAQMGMYVPYKIVNGSKVYYTQDKPEKPEKFDGLDYVPFDIVNGTKVFYPERVTTTPPPSSAMYVPYRIINDTKVYYPKDAQDEPQDIPNEYDGFDYIPYDVVDGKKVFRPDRLPGQAPATTERSAAMYLPYKLINGKKVYYPKDAQTSPEPIPEGYDGFDFVPYEVVNGTRVFHPERVSPKPEKPVHPNAMFVPYKLINGTKVYFPKFAQLKPIYTSEGYDGFDYLPYEEVNGTKVFRPGAPKPEYTSTPAFYPNGMFVPYKIIENKKIFFPKDAQHKPRPLKPGYDGVQYLTYDFINGTKVFSTKVTTPAPSETFMYVPFKFINGTKVYHADKATENSKEIPEGFEGFDYLPFKIVDGNKVFYPDRVTQTTGMYVPYKKVNGTKVYYPKDSSEMDQSAPEGYDGVDYIPYEIINGTKVFYPDRITTKLPPQIMHVPYKIVNGTKVYYPKDAQPEPYLVAEGYDGFDSLPYEIINGTKVFHPEEVTEPQVPTHPQGMFVPYKIINGTKVYYPQEAHRRPHPLSDDYAGLDYIPYEVVNGTKVFYPERVKPAEVPAMYVPYKLINGTKVFYPKHAQQNPQGIPSEYDGFDYVPYEVINGTQVFYPNRVPSYQGMYVPYKINNGEKIFFPKFAQHRPSPNLEGYDGYEYLPYESVNGTKVFSPSAMVTEVLFEQAMYVPYKLINGTKVYYPKYANNKPHLVPEGYDGFDYIPYETVNGTKVFDPSNAIAPGSAYKPALYVPYKFLNGIKVYQPKLAQKKPTDAPIGYVGFDLLPYDVINGNKIFYPEQPNEMKQAMYVPYKIVNGTKVFYPKYAQYVPIQISEEYNGFEYIPYEIVNGEKVFQPGKATATPFEQAMYVPYKTVNGTKVYYSKYAQRDPPLTSMDFEGFDYIPYEIVNGNKVFHPEQATPHPFRQALYVPFRVIDGRKVYYPNHAQTKPQLIPEGYDGFDYLPYEVVNGTKIFDSKASVKPTYLQGMYVPYKLSNNTKVFHPKDAQSQPNRVPSGYDGADYVPYELVNNTKMFYPELISTAQPGSMGSAGVYVPFKIINNKKVFYPKEATPFPPTVHHPYDGVAFVPNKALPVSEIVYVDNEEALKGFQMGQIPGEGSCYVNNRTFANNSEIPPMSPCQTKCICISSVVRCVRLKCPSPAQNKLDCSPVYREGSCCPVYACDDSTTAGHPEFHVSSPSGNVVEGTTAFIDFGAQKKPSHEWGGEKGSKPEELPSGEYHIHKPPKPKPEENESVEPYDSIEGQLPPDEDYSVEDEEPYGPGTCRYAGKVYVSAQQIPRDDPCDFCFCFRSDIICLQQSCPPPIPGCRDEPIQGFCCPRYECHVKMATLLNVTSTTTTTTTTLPPHFFPHAFKGSATRTGCFVQGRAYRVGQPIPSASGPCMDCICGGNGRMKCEPKVCTPEPMIRKMISPSENTTSSNEER